MVGTLLVVRFAPNFRWSPDHRSSGSSESHNATRTMLPIACSFLKYITYWSYQRCLWSENCGKLNQSGQHEEVFDSDIASRNYVDQDAKINAIDDQTIFATEDSYQKHTSLDAIELHAYLCNSIEKHLIQIILKIFQLSDQET